MANKNWSVLKVSSLEDIDKLDGLNLKLEDKTWLAAAIDGEGNIDVVRAFNSRKDGSIYYNPRLVVSNTNFEFIERLHEITGLGNIRLYKSRKFNHKDAYTWSICNLQDIKLLLIEISPHLIIKRVQAQLILSMPEKYIRINVNLREEIYQKIRILNKRGV